MAIEGIKWSPVVTVNKYAPETVRGLQARFGNRVDYGLVTPDETITVAGNVLTNGGVGRIVALLVQNGSPAALTNALGYTGVGDSSTGATAGQTALQASTNKYFQTATTSQTGSTGVFVVTSTYGSSDANFAWNEWCIGIANSSPSAGSSQPAGVMLNRKAGASLLGTKASGAVWTLTATVTIS